MRRSVGSGKIGPRPRKAAKVNKKAGTGTLHAVYFRAFGVSGMSNAGVPNI